ncbi:hypothetical protein F5Y01DRAFT_66663 [Xylaria sp. FL0043]|nr:hypothetical protein F5Y01DRAFT_66663 [Xylaria sp. FL0043]
MDPSFQRSWPSDANNPAPDMPLPWENVPYHLRSPATSSHRPAFSDLLPPISSPPMSTGLLSPIVGNRTSPYPASPFYSGNNRVSWQRRLEYDGEGNDAHSASLTGRHSLIYYEPAKSPYTTGALRTPSATPEPSDYSGGSSIPLANDPILEKLNRFRTVGNKKPLPPFQGLQGQEVVNEANWTWAPAQDTIDVQSEASQEPQKPQKPHKSKKPKKPKRKRAPARNGPSNQMQSSHCNVKYLLEELDWIRYQRVDLNPDVPSEPKRMWEKIAAQFNIQFPNHKIPPRETGGLQGAYYRQHIRLPSIVDGQLVFMENGHVDAVWVKTRRQNEKKHLYFLTYMYPERAMNYDWVTPADRKFASELNAQRELQKELARLEAQRRGTWVEKLPPDESCGCCPGEDRKRGQGGDDLHSRKPRPVRKHRSAPKLIEDFSSLTIGQRMKSGGPVMIKSRL